jgi:hypothetical protein
MNYDDKKDRYNEIVKGMGEDLKPIFDRMIDKSDKAISDVNPVDYEEYIPPCGITERNIPLTEEQIKDADDMVDQAISTILEATEDFPELTNQVPNRARGQAGVGAGGMGRRIKPLRLEFPEWLEDLESNLKSYFARKKGRKGYDWEEMVKGRISKAKEKIKKREDSLYVFLDTSGSMWGYTDDNGVPLMKLFGSYFPVIAKKYNGQVWQADSSPYGASEPIKKITELSDFRSYDLDPKDFTIRGGGGTNFWGVFQYFDKKVREAKAKNPDANVMLIFFSDMEADFESHPELIQGKEILFVTDDIPPKSEPIMKYVNGENIRLIAVNKPKKK